MICCDICLDWFHGKCVGITKAKGKVRQGNTKARVINFWIGYKTENFKTANLTKQKRSIFVMQGYIVVKPQTPVVG